MDYERTLVRQGLKRLWVARAMLFVFFAAGLVLGIAGQFLQGTQRMIPIALVAGFTACLLVTIAAAAYLLTHQCPRCGRPFFGSGSSGRFLSRACQSCGVRLDGSNI